MSNKLKDKLNIINYGWDYNLWAQIIQYVDRYIYSYSLVTKINMINPLFPNQFNISVASNDENNSFSDDFFIMEDIQYFNRFYVDKEPINALQKEAWQKEMENGSGNSIFIPSYYNDINQFLPIHFINFFLFMYAFRDYIKIDKDFHNTGKFLFEGKEMKVDIDNLPVAGIQKEMRNKVFLEHPIRTIYAYCHVYYQAIFFLLLVIIPVSFKVIKYLLGVLS